MSDTERRWSDRAWDVGLRVLGVLLLAVSSYFFVRQNSLEAKVQALEIKAAVVDTEKATINQTLGEIKADIKEIKEKVSRLRSQ